MSSEVHEGSTTFALTVRWGRPGARLCQTGIAAAWSVAPLGALAGGLVAQAFGPRFALLAAAAWLIVPLMWAALSRLRSVRRSGRDGRRRAQRLTTLAAARSIAMPSAHQTTCSRNRDSCLPIR